MSEQWPHDPDGDEGSEGKRKYGMAVIAKKVEDTEWPVERDAFVEEYGDHPVRVNHSLVISVGAVFDHVDEDIETFDDIVSFHRAVGDAMRGGEFWTYHPAGADPEPNRA
jgi:hypothetical protein